jgi:acetylornithine deacetylase
MSEGSPVAALLYELVAIDSTNPSLVSGGAGEQELVQSVARRLSAGGFDLDIWEVEPGRPNLVACLAGVGGGSSLMLCGHSDVVGAYPAAFRPRVDGGRLYGRGALDMKGGIAAAVLALERLASGPQLAGDVLLALCVDEEWRSSGAEALVERHRAAAAILPEPTDLGVVSSHGGFAWYELVSEGVEAAGDDPEHGVDAISLFGPVLTGVAELDRTLEAAGRVAGCRGSVHASVIGGGASYPSYPSECRLAVERCLIPGESVESCDGEVRRLLEEAERADRRFRGSWTRVIGRRPVSVAADEPVVTALVDAAASELDREIAARFDMGWMDSGILVEAGIPCVAFGPAGHGEHTAEEWVDIHSLDVCSRVLERAARRFCA